jgi:hypothetical protein
MKTDNALRYEAMELLMRTFGLVDAERFICMVKRDTFDYTEWRRDQWNDMSIDEIHEAAAEYARDHS